MSTDEITWGADVVKRGAYLLHGLGAWGRAVELFVYPEVGPCVRLSSGHTLIANPANFTELSVLEYKFADVAELLTGNLVKSLAQTGAAVRARPGVMVDIIAAVLSNQLQRLQREEDKEHGDTHNGNGGSVGAAGTGGKPDP